MEIDGLTSTFLNQVNSAQTSENARKVQNLTNSDLFKATDEELMDACKEFEAYLMEQVMQRMEKTTSLFSEEEEDANSSLVNYFMDSTIQSVAGDITEKQGLGIAQTLYESMKRQYNI